jgi:DNA-binding XRE family transcriptional regulator
MSAAMTISILYRIHERVNHTDDAAGDGSADSRGILAGTRSLVMVRPVTKGSRVRISQNPQVALGRAIRLRREEAGLTQEALADAANLDATSIRGLERGIANPTWNVADRIARALGLALHDLARRAAELETSDRRPTDRPLRHEHS